MLRARGEPFSRPSIKGPKTPGRAPRLAQPRVSATQHRALGEAYALENSVIGQAPRFQMPSRSDYRMDYSPDQMNARITGLSGAWPTGINVSPSDRDLLRVAEEGSVGPSQLAVDAAKNTARLRGAEEQQNVMRDWLDTDMEVEGVQLRQFSPYTPPTMPQREFAQYPTQQQVAPDRLSMALSALGGLFAPTSAGRFAGAPLAAANVQSERNWQDALDQYRVQQWMNDTRFGDASNQRSDTISTDLYNRQGLSQEDALRRSVGGQLAPIAGSIAEGGNLNAALPQMVAAETEAGKQGLAAGRLRGRIAEGLNRNLLETNRYASDVAGRVGAFELERKAYMDDLKFAADRGDKRAQRALELMRVGESSAHNQAMEGIGRSAVANQRFANETGRMNANTSRMRLDMEKLKAATEKASKPISELVWKHPEIVNLYKQAELAESDYIKNAMETNKAGNTLSGDRGVLNIAKTVAEEKRQALDKRVREIYNEYAAAQNLPPLPVRPTLSGAPPAGTSAPGGGPRSALPKQERYQPMRIKTTSRTSFPKVIDR